MSLRVKATFAAFFALFLTGCQATKPPTTPPLPITQVIVPRISSEQIELPTVMVVSKTNIDQVLAKFDKDQVFIMMTQEKFETLLETNQKLLVHIANENAVITTYEERITKPPQ